MKLIIITYKFFFSFIKLFTYFSNEKFRFKSRNLASKMPVHSLLRCNVPGGFISPRNKWAASYHPERERTRPFHLKNVNLLMQQ